MPRTSPFSITLADAERAELEARGIYVTVFRCRAGPDRAVRRRGSGRRRVRRTPGHATASRLQVAQTLLRRASGRPDRSASGRTAPEFFPLTSWSRSRRWPANCRRRRTRRWLVGSAPTWPAPPSSPASRLDLGHHDLALAEFGCDQALAAPVLDLPPRPRLRCQGGPCPRPLHPPHRRHPAAVRRVRDLRRREDLNQSRPASASTPPHHRRRAGRRVSSTNTPAAACWPTWPPGTPTVGLLTESDK